MQRSPRCEEDGRLSAKERLYVSKNAIGKYTNDYIIVEGPCIHAVVHVCCGLDIEKSSHKCSDLLIGL